MAHFFGEMLSKAAVRLLFLVSSNRKSCDVCLQPFLSGHLFRVSRGFGVRNASTVTGIRAREIIDRCADYFAFAGGWVNFRHVHPVPIML